MATKPANKEDRVRRTQESAGEGKDKDTSERGLAERSVTEHHVPGADGPSGAEAEEDNNP